MIFCGTFAEGFVTGLFYKKPDQGICSANEEPVGFSGVDRLLKHRSGAL